MNETRKIIDYLIVTEDYTGDMTERVKKEMEKGWHPVGHALPFNPNEHFPQPSRTFLIQTMVKYEEPE